MVTTSKIIKKILRSIDDDVLSIKTEVIRVDTQNSYYELTIDSTESTRHIFISVNERLKNIRISRDEIWDGFHVEVPNYQAAFFIAADINTQMKGNQCKN